MWKHLKGDRESMSEHLQPNMMEPRSIADEKELTNNAEAPMKPCSKPQVTTQEEKPSEGTTGGDKRTDAI